MASVGSASLAIVPEIAKTSVGGLKKQLEAQLQSAFSKSTPISTEAGKKASKGFSDGFGGIKQTGALFGVFSALANKALDSISTHIGDAASRFDTLNNYPLTLQQIGFSAQDAQSSIEKMTDRLDTLPTTLDSMAQTVKGLAVITGDLDTATDAGLALNDMLLASGSSLDLTTAAAEQFRQMLAKGKPDMQDWKSLTSTMPGQMDQLAKSMLGAGATANDLYAALGGGGHTATLTMNDLLDAIIKLDTQGGQGFASFQKQAEQATGGVQTSFANMQNAVTKGIAKVFDSIGKENIAGALNAFKGLINSAFSGIAAAVKAVTPWIKNFVVSLEPIAPALLSGIVPAMAVWKGLPAIFSKASGAASAVFGVASKLGEAFKLASSGCGTLSESLGAVGLNINPVMVGITALVATVGIAAGAFAEWKKHQETVIKSTQGLNDAVASSRALDSYSATVKGIGESAKTSAMSVGELTESIASSVDKMNENNKNAQTQIAQLNTAQGIISAYAGATDLATDAQGRLEWALGLLNEQFDLNITKQDVQNGKYTDANGVVQDLVSSIDALVAKKKEEARVSAITENLTLAYQNQSDAARTLADAQADYNKRLESFAQMQPELSQKELESIVNKTKVGQALKDAEKQYKSTTGAVKGLEEELGTAAAATSEAASAYDTWAANVSPLFSAQLEQNRQSLANLKSTLESVGVSTEDLGKLTEGQLTKIAQDYNGSFESIKGDLEKFGVGFDEAKAKASSAQIEIAEALRGLSEGASGALATVDISAFAQKLSEAGVKTTTLKEIGSANLASLAESCNGNIAQMVWSIQNYNATPILDKNGNITTDQVQLVDALGNIYTWNGIALYDKNNRVVTDDTSLIDAQGNVVTWNGTTLQHKQASAKITSNISSAIRERDNWNSRGLASYTGSATATLFRNIVTKYTNAKGGLIQTHADGGFIVDKPTFIGTDRTGAKHIAGEDGAEWVAHASGLTSVVPLTNKKYVQPFADAVARGINNNHGSTSYNITIDGRTVSADSRIQQAIDVLVAASARTSAARGY